jgi:pilus assembly protein CpaE
MSSGNVLVVTKDKKTMTTVQAVMVSRPESQALVAYKSLADLRSRLSKPGLDGDVGVVMVDIDQDPDRTLSDLNGLITAHPATRFMVLSTNCSERLILQAMQAGARHFLRKQSVSLELDNVIERLLSHEPEAATQLGDVISVFSCSGGCGATTVAVNLANELRLLCSQPVLVIDLDRHYGAAASHLGLTGKYGLAHILSRGADIDSHLIQTGAVSYTQGFDVLLSPVAASADKSLPIRWENLQRAVQASREPYRYVVIDAPRLPEQAATEVAGFSHTALVVFQLTVRDIAFAKSTIAFLRDQGMAPDRIFPVANRVNWRGLLLKLKESRDAIGMDSVLSIRNDWRKAIKSMNQGQPLAEVARRSRLRGDFHRLAVKIHKGT